MYKLEGVFVILYLLPVPGEFTGKPLPYTQLYVELVCKAIYLVSK